MFLTMTFILLYFDMKNKVSLKSSNLNSKITLLFLFLCKKQTNKYCWHPFPSSNLWVLQPAVFYQIQMPFFSILQCSIFFVLFLKLNWVWAPRCGPKVCTESCTLQKHRVSHAAAYAIEHLSGLQAAGGSAFSASVQLRNGWSCFLLSAPELESVQTGNLTLNCRMPWVGGGPQGSSSTNPPAVGRAASLNI